MKTSVTSENYRRDLAYVNYSALRLFSTCPRLYFEQYVAKTYVEPERDFFTYGNLVDCMLTTPGDLEKRFVRVDRSVSDEDALKYEMKIKELESELDEIKPKAKAGNKTAIKGVDKRTGEIEELRQKLVVIKNKGKRQQVTNAMWENATATAEAIRRNPTFQQLVWDGFTSQQVFVDEESKRKGILDYVRLSPPAQQIYSLWQSENIEYAEAKKQWDALPPSDHSGWIWDIKTTAMLSRFEPSIYAGQLGFYRDLVRAVTGIVCKVGIIVGDKDPDAKRAQDFVYGEASVGGAIQTVRQVERFFRYCKENNWWPPAKELRGMKQECFRCSLCSDRPFSTTGPYRV